MKIDVVRRPDVTAALAVALAVAAIAVWAQSAALVGVNYDDGIYALLARSIADGEGYRLGFVPGSIPGVKYPPLYPASLALFWAVGSSPGSTLWAMKMANGLYLGLAAGAFVLLLSRRRVLELPLAVLVVLASFASGFMMLTASAVLSEPLYLVVVFSALLVCDEIGSEPTLRRVLAIGVLAALAALTRSVGISLVGAAFVGVAARTGWRRALPALGASALLLLPWALFTLTRSSQIPEPLVPRYGAYVQLYLATLGGSPTIALEIALTNLNAILETAGANLVPGIPEVLRTPIGGLIFALALLGSAAARRKAPTLVAYHWIYLALITVWAFPPFRFLFVLLPVTLALATVALREVVMKVRKAPEGSFPASRLGTAVALALGAAFFLNLAYRDARALNRRVWEAALLAKSAVSQEVVDWVEANTAPDAVIAYEFEPLIALHTGRRAVPNNYEPVHVWYRATETPLEPLARLLREMSVDVLAVRADVPAAAAPIDALMGRYPGSLELVNVTPNGALIFRTRLGALAADAPAASPVDSSRSNSRGARPR